jgi:hypothetical protein
MLEMFHRLHALLADVIVPHLKAIQVSQAEQRLQTERLNCGLEEFRTEMQIRFVEIRSEIAACRQEIEDVMVTFREAEALEDPDAANIIKKRLIH